MLYKVTPAMEAPRPKKAAAAGEGVRKKRKTSVYDGDGNEVLISLMCLKCKTVKPLAQFGLRRMADGAMRNQPWCKGCRGAVVKKPVAELAAAPVLTPPKGMVAVSVPAAPSPSPLLQMVVSPVLAASQVLEVHEPLATLRDTDDEPTLGAEHSAGA
jgi:hypothetical protein